MKGLEFIFSKGKLQLSYFQTLKYESEAKGMNKNFASRSVLIMLLLWSRVWRRK
jgi:hypothetical protein